MEASKEVAKVGSAGLNLLLRGGILFFGAAIVYAGWNWSKKRAETKNA